MQIKVVNCPDIEFKPYVIRAVEFYGKELIPSKKNIQESLPRS